MTETPTQERMHDFIYGGLLFDGTNIHQTYKKKKLHQKMMQPQANTW
jgi:hypothetical protein